MVGVPATGAGAGSTPVAQQPSRVRIGPVVPVVRFDTHHLNDALERRDGHTVYGMSLLRRCRAAPYCKGKPADA